MDPRRFRRMIFHWHRRHGRHDLPWRHTSDPYRILVSELMLQQTQTRRVREKYRQFIRAFPTAAALDRATLAEVLEVWRGLGYNRRALWAKGAARDIVHEHRGRVPESARELIRLPGVGPATAGAVRAFAFGRRAVFVETNIRRVFLHHFFADRRRVRESEIRAAVEATLPQRNFRTWYWALMDYGAAALKGVPNPNRRSSGYTRQPAFRGSRRELRGRIVAHLLRRGPASIRELRLAARSGTQDRSIPVASVLRDLLRDGLLTRSKGGYALSR